MVVPPAGIKLTCYQMRDYPSLYVCQDGRWVLKELRLTNTVFSFEPTKNFQATKVRADITTWQLMTNMEADK